MKMIFTIRYAMAAITASAVIVALTIASCTKTEELSGAKEKITTLDASLDGGTKAEAVLGGDEIDLATGTKVAMTDNTTTMGVVWATNDPLRVFDGPASSSTPTAFTLQSGATTKYGQFTGSLTATAGDQIYAFYAPSTTIISTVNGVNIPLSAVRADITTPSTSVVNNYSVMYAGAKYTSGAVSKLTFKNAMVVIRVELPASGTYHEARAYSTRANMYNGATLTLSNGGTDGTAPDTTWTNHTGYGTRNLLSVSGSTDKNFSDVKHIYFMMLPQPSRYGLTVVFTSTGAGTAATAVYYAMITGGTDPLLSGKYYKIPNSAVKTGALLSSSTTPTSSDFWYSTLSSADVTGSANIYNALYAIGNGLVTPTRNITLVAAGVTGAVSHNLKDCDALETYINNETSGLASEMFNDCDNLKNVSIAGVTAIPDYAFRGCKSLEYISLPSAKTLGSYAFSNCSALTKIVFGSQITSGLNWATSNVFNGIYASSIDLVVKTGQTGITGGNTINGVTFKSISYKD